MKNVLQLEYNLDISQKIDDPIYDIYTDDFSFYYVLPVKDKESAIMERAALSHFLYDHKYHHMACPIPTKNGNWSFSFKNRQMFVCAASQHQVNRQFSHGKELANFHYIGTKYQYEPQNISSYGKWRELWIEKMTGFETLMYQKSQESNQRFYSVIMDILPYIIGISENAIQYIRESDDEERYDEVDQGTITFHRYINQMEATNIWGNQLTYDHPVRDIAEFIRKSYLLKDLEDIHGALLFLEDYQSVRTLSMFSFRQLYGRLLFPVHFFDCLAKGLGGNTNDALIDLALLIEKQTQYESRVKNLFSHLQEKRLNIKIPQVPWLT